MEIDGASLMKSVKLRLSVGRRAMVESLTIVWTPLCDEEMTELAWFPRDPVTPAICAAWARMIVLSR